MTPDSQTRPVPDAPNVVGQYSRKRLILIAVAWVCLAAAAFALSHGFGAAADDRGCGVNSGPPCAWPAENNIGGITLGTSRLQGQNLVTFGFDGNTYTEEVAPGRVTSSEEQVGLGISDITTPNMIIYKPWYYFDQRAGSQVPVYIWANATGATLSGSSQCGDGTNGWDGAKTCDLLANTSEIYTGELTAETSCDSSVCSVVPGTLTINNFWAVRPEDDTCGDLEALSSPCLAALSDGGTCVAGTCVTSDSIDGRAVFIRSHNYEAVRGPQGVDKELSLDNIYLEIRYSKGFDRAQTPGDPSGTFPQWAQPVTGSTGQAALSTEAECTGGGPNTDCSIPSGRASDIAGMTYDNIHG